MNTRQFFVALLSLTVAVVNAAPKNTPMEAIAVINGPTGVSGNVTFTQNACGETVYVRVYITGLKPGKHGFHVHEKGDLTNGCLSTGGHYNPDKMDHGGIGDEVRHVGDLGNVEANSDGVVDTTFSDHLINLSGRRTIVGRGIVVHENIDDEGKTTHPDSKKTGNAGGRVGCGVIGIKEETHLQPCPPRTSHAHSLPQSYLPPAQMPSSSRQQSQSQPTFYVPHDKPSDHVVYPLLSSSYHQYPLHHYASQQHYGVYQSYPYYYR